MGNLMIQIHSHEPPPVRFNTSTLQLPSYTDYDIVFTAYSSGFHLPLRPASDTHLMMPRTY